MDELISKQAAIDIADAVWCVTGDKNVAKVWDQIRDLPSADVPDKKIGKWIKNGNKYTCPFCGTGFTTVSEEVRSAHKYCYYCGAKMEG